MEGIVYETTKVNIPNLLRGGQITAIKVLKTIGHATTADIITIIQTAK